MKWSEIITESVAPSTFYHGTLAANVPNILKTGLQPSSAADAAGRWATLGGVYLTSTFDYAVKAAKAVSKDAPIAIVTVRLSSTQTATPDEDVLEKVLVKAFTMTLDAFGVDDAYDGDLQQYADAEENRPDADYDDKPFDRVQFFAEFWAGVMHQMSQLAGTPRRRDPVTIERAVGLALELADDDDADGPPAHWTERRWQDWQAVKTALVALYPRLRNAQQHAKAGVSIAHNIRVTKPISPRHISAIVQQDGAGWKTIFSRAL